MPARTLSVNSPVVAPSMLKCDFADLVSEVQRLEQSGAQLLHWDVMDGHFVPNLSYGAMVIESVRPRTELYFDAHLMIADPQKYLPDYLRAGCDGITIHLEAVPQPIELLEQIRAAGVHAGLAINPGTPVEELAPFLGHCDLVLVMSVQPGFGGQSFMPDVLPKVEWLRDHAPKGLWISIDGGIGQQTIAAAAAAGTQIFVAGSAIFDQPDYTLAMRDLETRAGTAVINGSAGMTTEGRS